MRKRLFLGVLVPALLALVVSGCMAEEEIVYCLFDTECLPSEYCLKDGTLFDENGNLIGACVSAEACVGGACPVGYDCVDGYCKPVAAQPQDYDTPRDDTVSFDDYLPPEDDYQPPEGDDAPMVDEDVAHEEEPIDDDTAPVADDAVTGDDDTPLLDTDEETDADQPADEDIVVPDADTDSAPAPFTAVFTSPGDGVRTKVTRPDLVITFSLPVDESTLVVGGGCSDPEYVITLTPAVTINTSTSGLSADGKTLTIKLSQDLANDTTYTITVPNSIKSTSGVSLAQTYSWTMTADRTEPTATLTVPSQTADVATDTAIEIAFSEAMDPATVTMGISLTITGSGGAPAVTGTPVWSAGDTVWTIQPDSPLETDTLYTITLAATISDVAGNTMNATVFTFSTADTIAPTVVATDPADGTDPTPVTLKSITVTFSEPVVEVDEETFTVKKTAEETPVIGTVTLAGDGMSASFTPGAPLEDATHYTVTLNPAGVSSVIADWAGNPLVGNDGVSYVFGFTTGASMCGDGYQTGAEACDDGNDDDGDYCAGDCSVRTDPGLVVVVSAVAYDNPPLTRYCPSSASYLGPGNRGSGRYCSNTQADFPINLGRNRGYMVFYSDSATTGAGFELWSGAPGTSTLLIKYPASGNYPNSDEKAWRLNAVDTLDGMTLRILGVEENGSTNCYDYVRVFTCADFLHTDQGITSDCDLRELYTGTTIPPVKTYPTSHMFVRLTSDDSTADDGWRLTANGVTYQCSPFDNYANSMNQVVPIVAEKAPLTIQFTTFRTEATYDFVYLYTCPPAP